jgi:hypothetical protein
MRAYALILASAAFAGGCDGPASTTPSPTSPASPAYTQIFTGTLSLLGSRFYSFSIAVEGTVNVTLVEVGGVGVDPTVTLEMGVGQPAGVTCNAGRTSVQASGEEGFVNMVSNIQPPGTYCVILADPGNLTAPATFRVSIEHP